jgi:hypothetical protein
LVSREELWSTWKGTVDTSLAYDGDRVVHVSSRLGDDVSTCDTHYLVLNGRAEPYQADAPAKLTLQVRRLYATDKEVFFNGKLLGTIPAKTPDKAFLSFDVPTELLARVNRVSGPFRLANVQLTYKKHVFSDLRYAVFEPHDFGKTTPASSGPEDALYICLP